MNNQITQLIRLLKLTDGWDGDNAPAPNTTAAIYASIFITCLANIGLHPTSVGPSFDGGIGITILRRPRIGSISVLNDGEMLAMFSVAGEDSAKIWKVEKTIQSISEACRQLKELMSGP